MLSLQYTDRFANVVLTSAKLALNGQKRRFPIRIEPNGTLENFPIDFGEAVSKEYALHSYEIPQLVCTAEPLSQMLTGMGYRSAAVGG